MTIYEPFGAAAAAAQIVGIDPHEGMQIIGAARLAARHHPPFDLGQPALVLGITDQPTAQAVRAVLGNAYPDDHPLQLICPDGNGARSARASAAGRTCCAGRELPRASACTCPPCPIAAMPICRT